MSEPVFDIRGLSLAYGQRVAVQDVDLQIRPHETTVLIGSNGCGKSTLLKGLSRQLAPSSGTISFQGTELSQVRSKGYARDVALLPQTPVVPEGLTVAELVARGRHPHRQWWGSPAAGDDEAVARALSMGGTCTGEHGIGQGKQKYLKAELGPEALDAMRALKLALDPQNIFNPGKIVPAEIGRASCRERV